MPDQEICPRCQIAMERVDSDYVAWRCPRCGMEAFETEEFPVAVESGILLYK